LFRIGPGLNKAPFQEWEDELIIKEREKLGNHWTSIANKLPGRTSCAVKSRWYSVLKNRQGHPRETRPAPEANALDITNLLSRPVRTELIGAWTTNRFVRNLLAEQPAD
jgi:hypothetical protein